MHCAGIQASEFKRKKLNLIILLDVSGSMGSPFDAYYYDQMGQQKNLTQAGEWRHGWGALMGRQR